MVGKVAEWLEKVKEMQSSDGSAGSPYLEYVKGLLTSGEELPFRLEQTTFLRNNVIAAEMWKENFQKAFLKKNSSMSSVEVYIFYLLSHGPKQVFLQTSFRT